ncbi:MAG: alpha/beta hydrolase [Burkholderiales bacterium]|nr:alpha/beta hydrolase [Burkholderiales bacterium]
METEHRYRSGNRPPIAYRRWRCPAPADRLPLVLIHGAASNLTRWSELVAETRLAGERDILRLDLRGHGQSIDRGPTSLEIWADDIAGILDAEGIDCAVLLGHCLGASVAVTFAARHPARTAGLILVEPTMHAALTGTLGRVRRFAPLLRILIGSIRVLNRLGLHRRSLDSLDLRALDEAFRARLAEPGGRAALEARYASVREDLLTMPTAAYLQDLVETVRPLPLERVRVPALVLLSQARTFADAERTRAELGRLARAEIRTIEAAHWIPTERPREMREAIEAWLEQLG